MMFSVYSSRIRTIQQGDDNFIIQDNLTLSSRAGFEIDQRCPREHLLVIQECIQYGWLRPVAYVKDSELMWETLQQ
jgi:hypothetical protein